MKSGRSALVLFYPVRLALCDSRQDRISTRIIHLHLGAAEQSDLPDEGETYPILDFSESSSREEQLRLAGGLEREKRESSAFSDVRLLEVCSSTGFN